MAIKVLEIHHHGVRIDAGNATLGDVEDFYTGVLGLERDKGRPELPGIPGMWINVGEVGQIHLIGGELPSPFAQGPGKDPTAPPSRRRGTERSRGSRLPCPRDRSAPWRWLPGVRAAAASRRKPPS